MTDDLEHKLKNLIHATFMNGLFFGVVLGFIGTIIGFFAAGKF